jgi:DNA (cytosine-5)-methyltransferase 1
VGGGRWDRPEVARPPGSRPPPAALTQYRNSSPIVSQGTCPRRSVPLNCCCTYAPCVVESARAPPRAEPSHGLSPWAGTLFATCQQRLERPFQQRIFLQFAVQELLDYWHQQARNAALFSGCEQLKNQDRVSLERQVDLPLWSVSPARHGTSLSDLGSRIQNMSQQSLAVPATLVDPVELFTSDGTQIHRSVILRNGAVVRTSEQRQPKCDVNRALGHMFDDAWLRRTWDNTGTAIPVTVADLFSGCGGLSVGVHEAARATGRRAVHVLAVDNNAAALGVFSANFPEAEAHLGGIEDLVDGELGSAATAREKDLSVRFAGLDLAVGGPPCQGHSDLNNHTRRRDPRNQLYLRMARFVEVVRPRLVMIENVPGVAHDRTGVVAETIDVLRNAGYSVSAGVVHATDVGAAQARRRHILLASRDENVIPDVTLLPFQFGSPARPVLEAIEDLDLEPDKGVFGTSSRHANVNQERIRYLFENNLYELPDEQRPDCHRLKPHSYHAVYGRMYPDRPAPTITAGFGSTGQGRFVHPLQPRTLTPHEAARVQGFPDWFRFDAETRRRTLQEMIGNAVPSKLAYAAVASLLR